MQLITLTRPCARPYFPIDTRLINGKMILESVMYKLYLLMLELADSENVSLASALQSWLMRTDRETVLSVRQSAYDLIAALDRHLGK